MKSRRNTWGRRRPIRTTCWKDRKTIRLRSMIITTALTATVTRKDTVLRDGKTRMPIIRTKPSRWPTAIMIRMKRRRKALRRNSLKPAENMTNRRSMLPKTTDRSIRRTNTIPRRRQKKPENTEPENMRRMNMKRRRKAPPEKKKSIPRMLRQNLRPLRCFPAWICRSGVQIWTKLWPRRRRCLNRGSRKTVTVWTTAGGTDMRTHPASRSNTVMARTVKFIIIRIRKDTKAAVTTVKGSRESTDMLLPGITLTIRMKTATKYIMTRMRHTMKTVTRQLREGITIRMKTAIRSITTRTPRQWMKTATR